MSFWSRSTSVSASLCAWLKLLIVARSIWAWWCIERTSSRNASAANSIAFFDAWSVITICKVSFACANLSSSSANRIAIWSRSFTRDAFSFRNLSISNSNSPSFSLSTICWASNVAFMRSLSDLWFSCWKDRSSVNLSTSSCNVLFSLCWDSTIWSRRAFSSIWLLNLLSSAAILDFKLGSRSSCADSFVLNVSISVARLTLPCTISSICCFNIVRSTWSWSLAFVTSMIFTSNSLFVATFELVSHCSAIVFVSSSDRSRSASSSFSPKA